MFIVECLPFSKGLNKDSLSYFSGTHIPPGSLIKVSLRSKSIPALVIKSTDAKESKLELRSADFQVKKITSFTSKPFLQKEFLETVKDAADFFATTEGAILSRMIPVSILKNINLLSQTQKKEDIKKGVPEKSRSEVLVLQLGDDERFDHYKSLIREEFAKKKSVFLCLPQNEDIKTAKERLERGIESFVIEFYSGSGQKIHKENLKKVCSSSHPLLIIATASYLLLPRHDLGTIIIDKENNAAWKTIFRPFIDLRFLAEKLAEKKNIRCILGDSFPTIETLYRYKQTGEREFERLKWRPEKKVDTTIADMREVTKKEKENKTLSPILLESISEVLEKKGRMFIFASRKGLATTIICRDCGENVKCFNCSSPMILHKSKTDVVFRCRQCGEMRDSREVCQNCKSWKLASFGFGIDKVGEEITKNFPEAKIFTLSKDSAETREKAEKMVRDFYELNSCILIGTEIAFSYLHKKVGLSAIAAFDSLFSVPDFRIREKIFRVILETQNVSKQKFIIQTRNPEDQTIKFAIASDLIGFYNQEIEDRRILGYPPFGIFIKITVRGDKKFVQTEADKLAKYLEKYKPAIFNSTHEKKGEQSSINAVIRFSKEDWPKTSLTGLLKSLPPHFEVKVDPDDLL